MLKARVLALALAGAALIVGAVKLVPRWTARQAEPAVAPRDASEPGTDGARETLRPIAPAPGLPDAGPRSSFPDPADGVPPASDDSTEEAVGPFERAISGRVLWPDGSPAVGVAVRAELDPFTLGDETSTGAEGDFALAVRGEGPFRVVAEADRQGEASSASGGSTGPIERFSASAPGIAPGSVGLRLVLDPGFVLAGRVRDDLGAPIDAFAIQAIPLGRGREVSRSFREAHGVFEVDGLGAGSWVVVAHAPDHGKGERIERTLPGDASALDFVLPRTGEIRGVVLGPDGEPVGSAEVLLDGGSRPGARRARTDAEGRFAFERAPAGPCRLVAWSETQPESEPVDLDLRAGEKAVGVVLRVPAR